MGRVLQLLDLPHEPLVPAERGQVRKARRVCSGSRRVDPLRTAEPLTQPVIDWEATLAYRESSLVARLWVAEAMDTAQRGMGLDWPMALGVDQAQYGGRRRAWPVVASGAGTDHLARQERR